MFDVRIHGFAQSTYTRTVRMAAIERSVPAELVPLPYGSPAHLAMHPFGKMPILQVNGTFTFESLACVARLDELGHGPPLSGRSPQVLQWASALVDYVYRPVVHGEGDAAHVLGVLDGNVGDRHVFGDERSVADLLLVPMLAHHVAEAPDRLMRYPRLHALLGRWSERPSFVETRP